MIKKDIVYREDDTQSTKIDSEPIPKSESEESSETAVKTNVDKIFDAADSSMEATRGKKLQHRQTETKRKKKKKPFRKFLLEFFIVGSILTILFCGLLAFSIIEFQDRVNAQFPEMKSSFLANVEKIQKELLEWDDEDLSVDDYYQKKLLLLFTIEEIDEMIGEPQDIQNFATKIFTEDGFKFFDIPEDKLEAYNQLVEEYQEAKRNEKLETEASTESSTMPNDDTTSSNEDVSDDNVVVESENEKQ